MLPNNSTEGSQQAPAGGQEQPTSAPSNAATTPLPEYVTTLQNQIADLTKQMRGLQSGTDKQIGQVRGDIKRILELKEQGLNEQQIQRELYLDQLMSGQVAPQNAPAPQPANGTGQQTGQGLDVDSVISSLKFEPNDPALAALKIKFASDPKGLVNAAADLRLSQLNSPNPTPGTVPPPGSGNVPQSGLSQADIEAKSTRLLRLYDNYSANEKEIQVLEGEIKDYWAKQNH